MKRKWKQIGSLILSVCMVFTMLPTMAFAETGVTDSGAPLGVSGTITVFEKLSAEVAEQTVETGTAEDELNLPDELTVTATTGAAITATVSGNATATDSEAEEPDKAEPEEIETAVAVSGWTSAPAYDGDTAGDYVFTPALGLPEGLTLAEGVTLPTVTVTVREESAAPQARDMVGPLSVGTITGTMNVGGTTVSDLTQDANGTSWAWNAAAATLTLGSSYQGGFIKFACDDSSATINLVCEGAVTVNKGSAYAIQSWGGLVIKGSGPLTVSGGLQASKDIAIIGTMGNISGSGNPGIDANGNIQIIGTVGDITGSNAIFAGGDITISNGAVVGKIGAGGTGPSSSGYGIYSQNGGVTINGATGDVSGRSCGIHAMGGNVFINGTTGDISSAEGSFSDDSAIRAKIGVAINGTIGAISSKGNYGVYAEAGEVLIKGETGDITGTKVNGIYAAAGSVTIPHGAVVGNIAGAQHAIDAGGSVTIGGKTGDITGVAGSIFGGGISANASVTITGETGDIISTHPSIPAIDAGVDVTIVGSVGEIAVRTSDSGAGAGIDAGGSIHIINSVTVSSGAQSAFNKAPNTLPPSYTATWSDNADGSGASTGSTYTWNASQKYVKIEKDIGGTTTGTMNIGGETDKDLSNNQNGTGWAWDAATATLTLNSGYGNQPIAINCDSADTINLVYTGDVSITSDTASTIYCVGSLGITGSGGTLTLNSTGTKDLYNAIRVDAALTIGGNAQVTASSANNFAIQSGGNLVISGSANVNPSGISNSDIFSSRDITLNTTGKVTAIAPSGPGYGAITALGEIILQNGTVTAENTAKNGNGIQGKSGISITGGTVTATAKGTGYALKTIDSDAALRISGGAVTLANSDNPDNLFHAHGGLSHTGGTLNGSAPGGVKLATPTGLIWDTTTLGKAKWTAVDNALTYTVRLYKDGAFKTASPPTITATEYDFTSAITETGAYTFTVIANAIAPNTSSDESEKSAVYQYTAAPAFFDETKLTFFLPELPTSDTSGGSAATAWTWNNTTKTLTLNSPSVFVLKGKASGEMRVLSPDNPVYLVLDGAVFESPAGYDALYVAKGGTIAVSANSHVTGGINTGKLDIILNDASLTVDRNLGYSLSIITSDLTLSGTGTVEARSANGVAVFCAGDLTVGSGCILNASGGHGIQFQGARTIRGGGTILANGETSFGIGENGAGKALTFDFTGLLEIRGKTYGILMVMNDSADKANVTFASKPASLLISSSKGIIGSINYEGTADVGTVTLDNTAKIPGLSEVFSEGGKEFPATSGTLLTITLNANGGNALVPDTLTTTNGKLEELPTPTRSDSYRFDGWFTAASGGTQITTSTVFTANTTIYAHWTDTSGGGTGGGTGGGSSSGGSPTTPITTTPGTKPNQPVTASAPVTATAGTGGAANAAITDKTITDAIAKAQADAKAQGKTANGTSVALDVTMPQGATSLTTTLTQSSLNSLVNAGVTSLEINGAPVSLGLDLAALKEIQRQSGGNITISIAPATGLSNEAKALIGNRPVYNITISTVKDEKNTNVTSLGNGMATLSIPYTPGKNEAVGYLFGVYVDANGKATRIDGSAYDVSSRCVVFTTTHFSLYGVGYTPPSSIAEAGTPTQRLAGDNRYATAATISAAGWEHAERVILAGGENFPDALAGTVLAGLYQSPILLSSRDNLSPETEAELKRLQAQTVYILGGPGVIAPNIEQQLAQDYTVKRIAGDNRYATAVEIGQLVRTGTDNGADATGANTASTTNSYRHTAILVTGENYPDALSIASLAGQRTIPILFTSAHELNTLTRQALTEWDIQTVLLCGGSGVLSESITTTLEEELGLEITRLAGDNRYLTALAIAQYLVEAAEGTDTPYAALATGENYPDALAGAALAVKLGMPVLLTGQSSIDPAVQAYLKELELEKLYIFGGTGAISAEVGDKASLK
ncbi:putative cell wall-binding protein [Desulfitobacterium sp. LBE]|nr:putative cell wall-binding protein [Desulfitobacterium sp. LBE]